jgi:hypothetical protein
MKVLQISPTKGKHCGIALFAERLAAELEFFDIDVATHAELSDGAGADLVLLQHHAELLDNENVQAVCAAVPCPVVLFAHSTGIEGAIEAVDGVMAMSSGLVPVTDRAVLVFPHPARIPDRLSERSRLRARFGLPSDAKIVGTSGFLRYERQFVEILRELVPQAAKSGWLVTLMTSPWYLDSPGLLDEITAVGKSFPGHFEHEHGHLSETELNLRLQACDLLWCWTRARSNPYASGVASDLYASGSRVVAADKQQHEHIIGLPNVVRAPTSLSRFVQELVRQMARGDLQRHDPSPISWAQQIEAVAAFLHGVRQGGTSRRNSNRRTRRTAPCAIRD